MRARERKEAFIWLRFFKGIVFVMGIIVGIIVGYLLGQSGWPIESSAGEVSPPSIEVWATKPSTIMKDFCNPGNPRVFRFRTNYISLGFPSRASSPLQYSEGGAMGEWVGGPYYSKGSPLRAGRPDNPPSEAL